MPRQDTRIVDRRVRPSDAAGSRRGRSRSPRLQSR
jgi:hypothetical protein